MNLQFDEDKLRTLIASTVLQEMTTPESRDNIIKSAIADILKDKEVQEGIYGTPKKVSPIQEAFNAAVQNTLVRIIQQELLADEGLRQRIKDYCHAALSQIIEGDKLQEEIISAIAREIGHHLKDYSS